MHRIRLAIADSDEKYLQRLCEYIRTAQAQRIQLSAFTDKDALISYMASGESADIFLVSREFDCDQLKRTDAVVLYLSADPGAESKEGAPVSIFKYQPGDRLIGRLFECFAEKNARAVRFLQGTTKTKLVTVYSPCGGSGKTTVALNLAIRAATTGKEAFYLNLETASSTPLYLKGETAKCFSHVLMYLNGKDNLLPIKIETAKVRDIRYGIDFFQPPESGIELAALKRAGTAALLSAFRDLGKYDVVMVDTDSVFNESTATLLEVSDKVVLVLAPDPVCGRKTDAFFEELKRLGLEKRGMVCVVNKLRSGADAPEKWGDFAIPYIEGLVLQNEFDGPFEFNSRLSNFMVGLANLTF